MTHIEALKQAIDALEHGLDYAKSEQFENAQRYKGYEHLAPDDADSVQLIETAITSLRQAIAEAEKQQYNPTSDHRLMEAEQEPKREPLTDEVVKLRGEIGVLVGLLGAALQVIDTIDGEDAAECEALMELQNKIIYAIQGAST